MNLLIHGDCLDAMRTMPAQSVDLCYMDPPFFSNAQYEKIWNDRGETASFNDRWKGGIEHYIAWLKERVLQVYRLLKNTGSIFIHCDHHANYRIRMQVLEQILGAENFRNEIIWRRANAHNNAIHQMPVLTDTILYFSKSATYTYNPQYTPLDQEYAQKSYRYQDDVGRYRLVVLTAPFSNDNDKEWRGYLPRKIGRSWSVPKEILSRYANEQQIETMNTNEKLELLYQKGIIVFSKNGTPNYKRYMTDSAKGTMIGNLWTDIRGLQGTSKELIGYPTQKPEALIERIINMASKQGDMILDPFCGGGTTCIAAQRLGRQWIGIDASAAAIDVSQMRMRKNFGSHGSTFEVKFERYDYNKLRTMNANDFADFICAHIGGRSNTKKSADGGIDGWLPDDTPIQIKRSDAIGKNVIKNLWSSVQEYDKSLYEKNKAAGKPVGVVYAFSFSKAAWEARSLMKNQHGVIIDLVEIEKLVPMTTALKIELKAQDLNPTPAGGYALPMPTHTIEFSANIKDNTNQQAANCAWDFNYDKNKGFNADELLYNKGKITRTMEAGIYNIAVKVVDDQGVETIEAIRLIVNGGVCANPLISGE